MTDKNPLVLYNGTIKELQSGDNINIPIASISTKGLLSSSDWTNFNTAYTNNLKWDGSSSGLNASTARASLGLVIDTNVQAWDANLDAIAGLAGTSGFLKKTAANTWTLDTSSYANLANFNTFISSQQIYSPTGAFQPYLDIALSGTMGANYPSLLLRQPSRYDRIQNTSSGLSFGYNYSGTEKVMLWDGTDLKINGNNTYHAGNITPFSLANNAGSQTASGQNQLVIAGTSASNNVFNGGIQLRERGYVADAQTASSYSPEISFHWANRFASSLALDTNNIFSFYAQSGSRGTVATDYRPIQARSGIFYDDGGYALLIKSSGSSIKWTGANGYFDHNVTGTQSWFQFRNNYALQMQFNTDLSTMFRKGIAVQGTDATPRIYLNGDSGYIESSWHDHAAGTGMYSSATGHYLFPGGSSGQYEWYINGGSATSDTRLAFRRGDTSAVIGGIHYDSSGNFFISNGTWDIHTYFTRADIVRKSYSIEGNAGIVFQNLAGTAKWRFGIVDPNTNNFGIYDHTNVRWRMLSSSDHTQFWSATNSGYSGYFQGSDNGIRIDGGTSGAGKYVNIRNPSTWAVFIETNQDRFYFNKEFHVDGNLNRYNYAGGSGWGGYSLRTNGNAAFWGANPTMYFVQNDGGYGSAFYLDGYWFYILRNPTAGVEGWDSGPNGRHPMEMNLSTGDVTFSGNVTAYSDYRLKTNIMKINNHWELLNMYGVTFNWKNNGKPSRGIIAQELQKIRPELVSESEDKILTVAYDKLIPDLLEMIRDLKNEIEYIKAITVKE